MILRRDHIRVLEALKERTQPSGICTSFVWIMADTGYDRKTVRRCCRYLAKRGLAEYHRALWTEDGEPAGAGYCITKDGLDKLEDFEVYVD